MENKKELYSINDIKNNKPTNNETAEEFMPDPDLERQIFENVEDIVPRTVEKDYAQENRNKLMDEIDDSIKQSILNTDEEVIKILEQKELESSENDSSEDNDIDDISIDDLNMEKASRKVINTSNYFKIDPTSNSLNENDDLELTEEDLSDLSENPEENDEQLMKDMQASIKDKIKPIIDPIDIKSFTISKNHISVNKSFIKKEDKPTFVVDWILLCSNKRVSMTEFKGHEIELLNPTTNGRTRYNMYRDIYKVIYSHIINEEKISFDAWVKSIKSSDINDLYFAVYKACFSGSNAIPYKCESCNNVYMGDYDIDEMVKYKNDNVKKIVNNLLLEATPVDGQEDVEMIPISDDYVITLRNPSIYSVIFENTILNQEFVEKYSEFLGYMTYIENMYFINRNTNELEAIDISIDDPRNTSKQIKNKILQYTKILKTLTSDQYSSFKSIISSIVTKNNLIDYMIPSSVCPKCGKVIPEQIMEPEQILFTRHQLAVIANTSIN